MSAFQPTKLLDQELSQPLQPIAAFDADHQQRYTRARVLVRLHTLPLGQIDVALPEAGLSADELALAIWDDLHAVINRHLAADELPPVTGLTQDGLPAPPHPACLQEREEALTATPPFISVIVSTRDRAEQLARNLPRLIDLAYEQFEIIIVDNAPRTSATRDFYDAHYADNDRVRYVLESRPGLSWARNAGYTRARGKIVAFIDDDEIPDTYWLREIAYGFTLHPDAACVTGAILPAEIETRPQDWFEQFGGHSKGRGFDSVLFNNSTHRRQHPLFPVPPLGAGGNMAFTTAVLDELKGFDTAMGAGTRARGAEDTAAFSDVILRGHTLVFQPSAFVRHFHYRDISGLENQLYGYGVGVTAFFMRSIIKNPLNLVRLIGLVPQAYRYFTSADSLRTATMSDDYPPHLNRRQRQGMLHGPLAYLRARYRAARLRHMHIPEPEHPGHA